MEDRRAEYGGKPERRRWIEERNRRGIGRCYMHSSFTASRAYPIGGPEHPFTTTASMLEDKQRRRQLCPATSNFQVEYAGQRVCVAYDVNSGSVDVTGRWSGSRAAA